VTEDDYNTRFSEYVTFGLGIHYLLKAVIIQFVALLLTYQFARPLSINVSSPNLFIVIYTAISVAFLVITFIFTRNICRRSISPKMHSMRAVLISTSLYHLVAAAVVICGYILLIVAVSGPSYINILDLFLSLLFTTAFAAILTVGYHDELDDRLPTVESLEDTIDEWIENTAWVNEEDNSQAQRDRLNAFEDSCTELRGIFSKANTRAGNQLSGEFEAWVSSFKDHNGQAKELVIQGQKHNKGTNPKLQMEHEEFERLKSRLKDLSTQYD
jgi:glucan phosphoethanolaminetransferase (alkaline phosphatase superfamily)